MFVNEISKQFSIPANEVNKWNRLLKMDADKIDFEKEGIKINKDEINRLASWSFRLSDNLEMEIEVCLAWNAAEDFKFIYCEAHIYKDGIAVDDSGYEFEIDQTWEIEYEDERFVVEIVKG